MKSYNNFPLNDLVEVRPLGSPSNTIYYIDMVYENHIIKKKRIRKEKFQKLFDGND